MPIRLAIGFGIEQQASASASNSKLRHTLRRANIRARKDFFRQRNVLVHARPSLPGRQWPSSIRWPYAAVVAAPALRVAGSFGKPPDTASMQRLRASLREDA